MIAAGDPQEFFPNGRQHVTRHPGFENKAPNVEPQVCSETLSKEFEKVILDETKTIEKWLVRSRSIREDEIQKLTDECREINAENTSCNEGCQCCYKKYIEEELYVKNNCAVWSKGLSSSGLNRDSYSSRVVKKTFTLNNPIRHALWAKFFHQKLNFAALSNGKKSRLKTNENPINCICLSDNENIYSFTENSEDFITSLPFVVDKIFEMMFGIVIEKDNENECEDNMLTSTILTLTHPLDEFSSLGIKEGGVLKLLQDTFRSVVFVSNDPSFCVLYDERQRRHSVYLLREIDENERLEFLKLYEKSVVGLELPSKSKMSFLSEPKRSFSIGSPFSNSRVSNLASSRSQSSMATISRCQSPAMSPLYTEVPLLNRLIRQNLTRSTNICSIQTPHSIESKLTACESTSQSNSNQFVPQFCLDHLWTEPQLNCNKNSAASRVFICKDLAGRRFLAYLVSSRSCLNLVEISEKNEFINLMTISAKDVQFISSLKMIAVLDHSYNICLYSGTTYVGKLHIGGALVKHSPSPSMLRTIPQFHSPFPRRSTLLPQFSTPISDPNFDLHLLSPVLPITPDDKRARILFTPTNTCAKNSNNNAKLSKLRDAVENRLTLQYTDGACFRITFPPMTESPLIKTCIGALSEVLDKESTQSLICKWYAVRNAPGNANRTNLAEWQLFVNLIFESCGYCEQNDSRMEYVTPSSAPKKQKISESGSENDWEHLLNRTKNLNNLKMVLNLRKNEGEQERIDEVVEGEEEKQEELSNTKKEKKESSILNNHKYKIFNTLHLVYEEMKLNSLRHYDMPLLASFLNKFAFYENLRKHEIYYWKDFPDCCKISIWNTNEENVIELHSIFSFLVDLLEGNETSAFPYVPNVNNKTCNILKLCILYVVGNRNPYEIVQFDKFIKNDENKIELKGKVEESVVELMVEMGMTNREMDTLPSGINLLLHEALWKCRENPPTNWSAKAYNLLQRPDLAAQTKINHRVKKKSKIEKYGVCGSLQEVLPTVKKVEDLENEDGMEDLDNALLKLRFAEDHRVAEARKLLQSSKPVTIALVQRPDVTDHDFIDEQEKHLYAICSRTMALPAGRGMMTMRSAAPIITEPLPCPRLCLTGKSPPCGATVELTHIDTPPNMNLWPLFHNGVANGLRIAPDAGNIDSNWIVFNKPKNSIEATMEHAGFLMALGLNGHLKNLTILKLFDYLSKFHEMTSVGILLGMSAARRGTSCTSVTKILSIHVEALLPPTSMELDIPQNLQIAAMMGVGLVYRGTCHRHVTEVLLTEIGRPPGPEMDNSVDRESYALAAGLALGLVTLNANADSRAQSELADLNVPDALHHYMVGGNRRPLRGAQKDKYKVTSFQIKEGAGVNLDVTAPAATLALGLMYMRSGNKAVADWMAPPTTQYLLDFVRPDFLMLRTLARSLILWDNVTPSKKWVESQVPDLIRQHSMVQQSSVDEIGIDYEAMNQAYCNIVAGACFALGLKYAGCACPRAYETLIHYCHMFMSLSSKSIAELAGKPTIETCLNVLLISTSIVMAGTGDLEIMRIVRHLRRRVGVGSSSVVTYGSHLAVHMALGMCFLGAGRYTFSNSPESVAALVCAFYPKFPTHSNDNRYHLQAFRHLYVLAVEPRILIPKDVSTGKMCYAWLKLIRFDDKAYVKIKGPGLIPQLDTLSKVCVDDERYWPVVFERGRNWDLLLKLINSNGFIEVKQRAGCLSHLEDKLGFLTQLARTLTQSSVIPWDPPPKSIISFSSDSTVRQFTNHFLITKFMEKSDKEAKFQQVLTRATYDYVTRDKLPALPISINLVKCIRDVEEIPNVMQLSQMKIIQSLVLNSNSLISKDFCLSLMQQMAFKMKQWESYLLNDLKKFVFGQGVITEEKRKLALYIAFYDIPEIKSSKIEGSSVLEQIYNLNRMNLRAETIEKLIQILNDCN